MRSEERQIPADLKRAVELAHPDVDASRLEAWERKDLEAEISRITGKIARSVSFYSLYDTDFFLGDDSLWVVVRSNTSTGAEDLYTFEDSDDVDQAADKFNKLLPRSGSSVNDEKAMSIARLFLACCAQGASGETVTDETDLREAVGSYYFELYGNIWRSLDAYTQWWDSYSKVAPNLAPALSINGNVRQISVNTLRSSVGVHPQLQQWELEVSSNGSVHVLAVTSIFPKQRQWLSYDFRSMIER